MDKKVYENIYNVLEKNSIGNEKKCPNNRKKKKVILKISLGMLTGLLIVVGIIGSSLIKLNNNYYEQIQQIEDVDNNDVERYGYSIINIQEYGKLITKNMLKEYGFDNYTINDDNYRHYNYTSDDYKKIINFDERYLYSLYLVVDDYTINEFTKSLGYKDLDDYLIKNNYIDDEGKASTYKWLIDYLREMAKIMNDLPKEEGRTK